MENPKKIRHGLLWFGAAISLAEMMTGTLIAPLGWGKGLLSVVLGHTIGCVLLYFAGLIGAKTGLPAVKSSRIAFGKYGSYAFSVFNIIQLFGWTAIMIMGGSAVLNQSVSLLTGFHSPWVWTLVIGGLVALWIAVGLKNVGKLNIFAVGGLFLLTVVLSFVVFDGEAKAVSGTLSFGAAVELSIAMPLSWLPLISDYTRYSNTPKKTAAISATTYFFGSVWMYVIGMGLALFVGETDIGIVLAGVGFGIVALLIALFSTVTTTFLDAYSAGVSFSNMTEGKWEKGFALCITAAATILALFFPMNQYENFLYLIGSFFVPMITILMVEFFLFGRRDIGAAFRLDNAILWVVGFILYRIFLSVATPIGSTLPVMAILAVLCYITHKFLNQRRK